MELSQKLPKSMPRRRSLWDIYTRENYLCKKLEVKEGEWRLVEGGVIMLNFQLLKLALAEEITTKKYPRAREPILYFQDFLKTV